MAEFSLSLSDDQIQIRDWIHQFAVDVVRPAAHEWDEREEFPWPIVQEAAKIGLYGLDFMMNAMGDKSGLTLPVAIEELFWGDAGTRCSQHAQVLQSSRLRVAEHGSFRISETEGNLPSSS